MKWIFLSIAVLLEVAGTIALKLSGGLHRLGASMAALLCYGLSLVAFTLALKKLDVGIAYPLWSALATVLLAAVGVLWFEERTSVLKLASLAMIVAGVLFLGLSERGL